MADQADKLRKVSKNVIRRSLNAQPARVIAITSGKGGVGKTNFAVNLALALTKYKKQTLIIDADLGMGNVDVVLGCNSSYNIMHLKDNFVTMNDIVITGPLGIKFLPGGSGFQQLETLTETEIKKIIDKVLHYEDPVDYIIVDTGAGLNHNMMRFLLAADEIILIATPEPPALTDAYAVLKTYILSKGESPVRLVLNRVADDYEGAGAAEKIQKVAQRFLATRVELLGCIKEDTYVSKAIKQQNPVLITYPNCSYARSIYNIANHLAMGGRREEQKGFLGFLSRLFNMH